MTIYVGTVERKDGIFLELSDDPRKTGSLVKSRTGISPDDDNDAFWEEARQLQREFQDRYCPGCVNSHPRLGFRCKGHPNQPQDCRYHWTDIVGVCWNYRDRIQTISTTPR